MRGIAGMCHLGPFELTHLFANDQGIIAIGHHSPSTYDCGVEDVVVGTPVLVLRLRRPKKPRNIQYAVFCLAHAHARETVKSTEFVCLRGNRFSN
jgi:hypothetical protein